MAIATTTQHPPANNPVSPAPARTATVDVPTSMDEIPPIPEPGSIRLATVSGGKRWRYPKAESDEEIANLCSQGRYADTIEENTFIRNVVLERMRVKLEAETEAEAEEDAKLMASEGKTAHDAAQVRAREAKAKADADAKAAAHQRVS
jgi:hypothetical protein